MSNDSIAWKFFSKATKGFDKWPLCKCVLKAFPLVVGASIGSNYAHQQGWLAFLENRQIDAYISAVPLTPANTQIVQITDDDYRKFFASTSPLKAKAISDILEKIGSGNPRAIVVDVDTSDATFSKYKMPRLKVPVIWARTAVEELKELESYDSEERSSGKTVFQLEPLLGRQNSDEEFGVSLFPQSSDGVVRYYCRAVLVRDGTNVKTVNTLPWHVLDVLGEQRQDAQLEKKLLLPLAKNSQALRKISVGQLYVVTTGDGWKETVRDKIVILGGTYRAARDSYLTAAGRMDGVALVAQALEGEMQGRIPRDIDSKLLTVFGILVGLALSVLNCKFKSGYVLFAGFILIPVLGFAISFLLAQTASLWIDFLPVLFAVQLHSFWDFVREHEELALKLEKLERPD